jgi:hypothetical protein
MVFNGVTSGQEWTHLPPETGPTKPEIVAHFTFRPGSAAAVA